MKIFHHIIVTNKITHVRIVKMFKDQKDSMFCEIFEISSFIENFDIKSQAINQSAQDFFS